MNPSSAPPEDQRCDVVIIGAGPVGSLLACLLGAAGTRVLVLEKRTTPPSHSMAIGITPPSLQILERIGLAERFVAAGVRVRDCLIHGESGSLGRVSFRDIPGTHRFILSLQQAETIALLRETLARHPGVALHSGMEVVDIAQDAEGVAVSAKAGAAPGLSRFTARFAVACDGARSPARALIGEVPRIQEYDRHFLMGDFDDTTGLGDEAHLFFTADGSVESFPLPSGQRRWIVQTDRAGVEARPGFLRDTVRQRTGYRLGPEQQLNASAFTPRRYNCRRYHRGRVILCGDAAHGMSPVGGQGMNTGFADAELLAEVLTTVLRHGVCHEPLLARYGSWRRAAAQSAIARADWSMWLGTWRGRRLSALRDLIIRHGLCRGPLASRMGPFYAMLTLPRNSLAGMPSPAFSDPLALTCP